MIPEGTIERIEGFFEENQEEILEGITETKKKFWKESRNYYGKQSWKKFSKEQRLKMFKFSYQ